MKATLREARILKYGSEYFTISVEELTAGTFRVYDIDTTPALEVARKYKPLDFIEITNNSDLDIKVQLNFQDIFFVPHKVIKTIEGRAFYAVKVINTSLTTALNAGDVILTMQRMPITVDTYIQRVVLR